MHKVIAKFHTKRASRTDSDLSAPPASHATEPALEHLAPVVEDSRRSSSEHSAGEEVAQQPVPTTQRASDRRIEFLAKDSAYFWLSNGSDYPVVSDGLRYPTSEHLFQALKFVDTRPDISAKVRKAPNPIEAIRIARLHAAEVRPDWIKEAVNVQMMRMVLVTKFSQYSKLREALLETGDLEIVNANPNDAFWGSAAPAGSVGRGRNMLGRTLMQTRELMRVAAGVGAGSGTRTV